MVRQWDGRFGVGHACFAILCKAFGKKIKKQTYVFVLDSLEKKSINPNKNACFELFDPTVLDWGVT